MISMCYLISDKTIEYGIGDAPWGDEKKVLKVLKLDPNFIPLSSRAKVCRYFDDENDCFH
jgi:hypothetical protein